MTPEITPKSPLDRAEELFEALPADRRAGLNWANLVGTLGARKDGALEAFQTRLEEVLSELEDPMLLYVTKDGVFIFCDGGKEVPREMQMTSYCTYREEPRETRGNKPATLYRPVRAELKAKGLRLFTEEEIALLDERHAGEMLERTSCLLESGEGVSRPHLDSTRTYVQRAYRSTYGQPLIIDEVPIGEYLSYRGVYRIGEVDPFPGIAQEGRNMALIALRNYKAMLGNLLDEAQIPEVPQKPAQ